MTSGMEGAGTTGAGYNGSPRPGEQIQDAASGLVNQAARTAEAQASTTMTKAGETLQQVSQAIRDAGENLRESQPQVAGLVDTAATRLDDAATYLRDHDAGEAVANVQEMARRQPAIVIGGGLAIGLLVGRLLRSGASGSGGTGTDQWRQGYGDAGTTGFRGQRGTGSRYGGSYAVDINPGYADSDFGASTYAGGGTDVDPNAIRTDLDIDRDTMTEGLSADDVLAADEREVR
jgi:ElaB/YqjD/DUF883 family membrane-anchored ribosome-binding protein